MTLDVLTSAPPGATVATLARREARRTVRHPVNLVLLAYFIVLGGVQAVDSGLSANEAVPDFVRLLGLLWLGPATFFTANLIASAPAVPMSSRSSPRRRPPSRPGRSRPASASSVPPRPRPGSPWSSGWSGTPAARRPACRVRPSWP